MALNNRKKGSIGENIACEYLVSRGYSISARNYRKVWGEIDIVAEKDNIIHFIEVKSIVVLSFEKNLSHYPEENVHGLKLNHIRRMIETYLLEYDLGLDKEFKFHVICVYLNMSVKRARIRLIENIIP